MKKYLQIIHMKEHSEEWYAFRQDGIGGSEAAYTIGLGHPKYGCAAKVYHEKVGTYPVERFDNQRMFWGRQLEDKIADVWRYYDNTEDGYLENNRLGNIVRNCRNVNGYIVNPNYPWLFASVDRLMNKEGGINFISGKPLENEAILECKNVGQFASTAWVDGMPLYFLVQVHVYMIILETDYAEVAMLIDGGQLQVEKIQRDDEFCERIISKTKSFWYDKVLPAKEAKKKMDLADNNCDINEAQNQEAIIQQLEPDPDSSEAYTQFQNEKFVKERPSVKGSFELFNLARKDHFYNEMLKEIKKKRTLIKNICVKFLVESGAESIDFGKAGRINYSEKKGSQNRVFGNKTKEKPTEDKVETEFNKLDSNF